MNVANEYFVENQRRQEAKKELMKNQSDYYKSGKVRNDEWTKVARSKNNGALSKVKGKVRAKTIKLWKSDGSVDDVDWNKRDFMQIISNVQTMDDPIFNILDELLSGLEEYEDFEVLADYVRQIYDMCKRNEVENVIIDDNV